MSELGEGEEQVGSYAIYFAEGETLAKQKEFKKAAESFTKVFDCTVRSNIKSIAAALTGPRLPARG